MTPIVLAATLLAAILILVLPRKYAVAPIFAVMFLTPFGQQVLVGGFHFYVIRIIVLAGALRLLAIKVLTKKPLFGDGVNGFDKIFCLWAFVRGLAFILRFRESGAVFNQAGLWLDAFGGYFLIRYLLRDKEDIFRAIKVFASVATVLAGCMLYEFLTRVNVFSYFAGHTIVPWIRNGHVRAQAVYGNSITAGAFGATLLPLFFWLWKGGKARLWGITGLVAAAVVAITSVASTPITGFLAGILALCLWQIRDRMRVLRWGMLIAVLLLSIVMNAPVWFVITKVNFVGGDSWDRANLISQSIRHFSDWWLVGTNDNANWGDFTWDQCNQFMAEGLQGGLATLVLFIVMIQRAFSAIGRCRKRVQGNREEWFFWCLGAALFAHIIVFLGVDYFDQSRQLWFTFLAMVAGATYPALAAPARGEATVAGIGKPWQQPPADPGAPAIAEVRPLGEAGRKSHDTAIHNSSKLSVGARLRNG